MKKLMTALLATSVFAMTASTSLAGEIAVGCNGWIWMHAVSSSTTILLYNIIRNAPVLTEAQTRAMIRQMVSHYKQQEQLDSQMHAD